MFTLRIPEQKSLAKIALHVEQINFGKMFLKKLKIQLHFLPLRGKKEASLVIVAENISTTWVLSSYSTYLIK